MLRIGEASRLAGVTPATFRRWEAQGLISSVRTAGGERRYREEDIDRLLSPPEDGPPKYSQTTQSGQSSPPEEGDEDDTEPAILSPELVVQPWDRRVHEARADLEVMRLQEEVEELERRRCEVNKADEQQRRRAQMDHQQKLEQEQEERSERERLASIRSRGEMIAAFSGAPAEHRAAVTRDLSSYVTGEQFPPSLNDWQIHEYLTARIDGLLKPWRTEQAAERKSQEDIKHVENLIRHGHIHASTRTLSWDSTPRERAKREVAIVLRDEVEAGWTGDDTIALVDEVLDEWE